MIYIKRNCIEANVDGQGQETNSNPPSSQNNPSPSHKMISEEVSGSGCDIHDDVPNEGNITCQHTLSTYMCHLWS